MGEVQIDCDGACENHIGDVIAVNVVDQKDGRDWGDYNYCEAAIEEDRDAGFAVTILRVQSNKEE